MTSTGPDPDEGLPPRFPSSPRPARIGELIVLSADRAVLVTLEEDGTTTVPLAPGPDGGWVRS